MLQGARVRLRAVEDDDLDLLWRWRNDLEVAGNLNQPRPWSRADVRAWVNRNREQADQRLWFIIETQDGRPIGRIGLTEMDSLNRHAELNLVIGEKEFQGQGLGQDAARTLVRYAFEQLGLNKLWLVTLASNERALICFERCGFRRTGVMQQHMFRDGKLQDVVVMEALNGGDTAQDGGEMSQ